MFDKVLEFVSYFDWITPLSAFWLDWANRPAHTFLIPEDCGRSAKEIQYMLRRHGIKTWGVMIFKGSILITMRLAQAYFAQYLLEREDIPITDGYLEERPIVSDRRTARHKRASSNRTPARAGIWSELSEVLRDIAEELSNLVRF
jgi:hypothetical protein